MTDSVEKSVEDRRSSPREPFHGRVSVRLDTELHGPGQNISSDGLSFVATGTVEVLVTIEGSDEPIRGELVRLTPMGHGTGIAVRFLPEGSSSATPQQARNHTPTG